MSFTITPSTSTVTFTVTTMASFMTPPPGGLFTVECVGYDRHTVVNETSIVDICNRVPDKYEFGYNGQMKVNEVAGTGNWNTALHWEYNTRIVHRGNPDPVRNPSQSPYAVFDANPILKNDINGDAPDLNIQGSEADKALEELQKSTTMKLNKDEKGNVTTTDEAKTEDDKRLKEVLDDHSILVNVDANDTKMTSDKKNLLFGGAFMGNSMQRDANSGNDVVIARQEINPIVLGRLSNAYNTPGKDALHEVTEAFIGAKISQKAGIPSPSANQPGSVYKQAHKEATKQNPVYITPYSADGKPLENYNGAVKIEWWVQPKNKPIIILQTYELHK